MCAAPFQLLQCKKGPAAVGSRCRTACPRGTSSSCECVLVAVPRLTPHVYTSSCWYRWVTLCAWEHLPGHSLMVGESTLSIPVLEVPSMSPSLCSIVILLFIRPRQQHGLDDFCSCYDPQQPTFLQKNYLFHICVTGFSHQHSGPCTQAC